MKPTPTLETLSLLISEKLKTDYEKEVTGIVLLLKGGEKMRLLVPKANNKIDRRHSDDYRAVIWDGIAYKFTPLQAAAVKMLWESEFQELSQQVILEEIGSDSNRLRDLFKDHQAWGEMIIPGEKGTVKLS